MIRLENGTIYFLINGVPQQRGSVYVVIDGEGFVGLRFIGSERQLVAPVHFSDWEDGTLTPYPTRQALFDDLALIVMESNAAGIPDAPVDGTAYVRKDGAWVPEAAGAGIDQEYTESKLAAPVATTSDVLQLLTSITFTPLVAGSDWEVQGDWSWVVDTEKEYVLYEFRFDGVPVPGANFQMIAAKKNNPEIASYTISHIGLTAAPHTVDIYFANQPTKSNNITVNFFRLSARRVK